jgi:hypothetical protein
MEILFCYYGSVFFMAIASNHRCRDTLSPSEHRPRQDTYFYPRSTIYPVGSGTGASCLEVCNP